MNISSGSQLVAYRNQKRVAQNEVAKELKIKPAYVCTIEKRAEVPKKRVDEYIAAVDKIAKTPAK